MLLYQTIILTVLKDICWLTRSHLEARNFNTDYNNKILLLMLTFFQTSRNNWKVDMYKNLMSEKRFLTMPLYKVILNWRLGGSLYQGRNRQHMEIVTTLIVNCIITIVWFSSKSTFQILFTLNSSMYWRILSKKVLLIISLSL